MAKPTKRECPQCHQVKEYRADQKTCGCKPEKRKPEKLQVVETNEVTDKGWAISLPQTRIHTLDQLIEFFEIDLSEWEVERFVANKWEVAANMGGEELTVSPLYQVKAFLKKRVQIVDAKAEIEDLRKQSFKEIKFAPPSVTKNSKTTGNMLEIDIADHHFGKLAWAAETGDQNYDTKIAEKLFKKAFYAILDRASGITYDEIWMILGNDLLNSDNAQGTTTRGTQVSTDSRYQKTFSVVRNTAIECIEELRKRSKKVKVIMVPGNHDTLSTWHLGDSLECRFYDYKDVDIDNEPRYYKYHQFGKVMIMYTHGDKGRYKEYPMLMAAEQPDMFGETRFREVHTGHQHRKEVDEQYGVRVRRMSALCPPDAWHSENGFVGNLRSAEAFQWNKDEGLIGTVIYTDNRDKIED